MTTGLESATPPSEEALPSPRVSVHPLLVADRFHVEFTVTLCPYTSFISASQLLSNIGAQAGYSL